VFVYETLFEKNRKIPDGQIIERSCQSGFILVTKDESMESEWIEDIIAHKARVILLTDGYGNVMNWAASLIASEKVWHRALLDHPFGPLVIRINREGVQRIDYAESLSKLCQRRKTARIVRSKRNVAVLETDGTNLSGQ
jgi:hypothetical protein